MIKKLGFGLVFSFIMFGALIFTSGKTSAATVPPTLDSPSTDTTYGIIPIEYTLGENPLEGTPRLIFNGNTTITISLNIGMPVTGPYVFTINPNNVIASGGGAILSTSHNVIPDGTYTVALSYQNASGDPAATVSASNVTIDSNIIDTNGDGTADNEQDNISSYVNSSTGKRVVIDVGENCDITVDDMTRESSLPVQDADYDYENDLFDFAGDCGTPGATTTVKLYYYDVSIAGLVMRKYNPNTQMYSTISGATIEQQTINGYSVAVVSYQITDGGALDMDTEANGEIVDPAGLGSPVFTQAASTQNPTLANTGANTQKLTFLAIVIMTGAATLFLRSTISIRS